MRLLKIAVFGTLYLTVFAAVMVASVFLTALWVALLTGHEPTHPIIVAGMVQGAVFMWAINQAVPDRWVDWVLSRPPSA